MTGRQREQDYVECLNSMGRAYIKVYTGSGWETVATGLSQQAANMGADAIRRCIEAAQSRSLERLYSHEAKLSPFPPGKPSND